MPAAKVFCCVPVRIGAIAISAILLTVYLAGTIAIFVQRQGMRNWATLVQAVDVPLTNEAFDGVFGAMAAVSIAYTLTHVYGLISIILQKRKLVKVYHIVNWFFVLLILTISLSYWFYFKVKRDVYINDCQDLQNNGAMPFNDTYTPVVVPGKNILAGGSDKSHCISLVNKLVIASGVVTFLANMIQLYFASCIGTYAFSLNWQYLHQRLQTQDVDELAMGKIAVDRD
ncbi:hypothetical protein LRAMOSA11048 [Lichtheimia ramosa]|uniref:MARVEL domain-containing protein n=1 Tax=Lichtheimia ramosa TaxID=688394 RepID=A0A077WV38_9FUNG|nr:hypothetical protein LRAMOSA11048 [Lichtheimia ramosa]